MFNRLRSRCWANTYVAETDNQWGIWVFYFGGLWQSHCSSVVTSPSGQNISLIVRLGFVSAQKVNFRATLRTNRVKLSLCVVPAGTTYTCMYNLYVYVKPIRVCTTYTCMYCMPSTAATHIEDLPIKQLPFNALEKLLKGPKFLTVHIVLLRGTPHRCHHSVSQLPGAGVELHALHYCISTHRHHIHCMLVSHCLC